MEERWRKVVNTGRERYKKDFRRNAGETVVIGKKPTV